MEQILDLTSVSDSIVLYFNTPDHSIRAQTLSEVLAGLNQAAKAVSLVFNEAQLTIKVDIIGPGSIRVKLTAELAFGAKTIFWGAITTALMSLTPFGQIQVTVEGDQTRIQSGLNTTIIKTEGSDALAQARKNKDFRDGVSRMMLGIARDDSIDGFSILPSMGSPTPPFTISGEELKNASKLIRFRTQSARGSIAVENFQATPTILPLTKVVEKDIEVQIVRKRTSGIWDIVIDGFPVKAVVKDQKLLEHLKGKSLVVAKGDSILVTIEIVQTQDAASGVYSNTSYTLKHAFGYKTKTVVGPNARILRTKKKR